LTPLDNQTPIQIRFQNATNPKSAFEIITLADLYKRKYEDHNPEQLHKVDFYIILFITEGKGLHTIDFTKHQLSKGSVLTIRKNQIHKFHQKNNLNGFLLLFTDEFLVSYLEKLESQKAMRLFNELLGNPKIKLKSPLFEKVVSNIYRINSEYVKNMDEYALGIIRSELHILITTLFRIKSTIKKSSNEKKYLDQFIHLQELVEKEVQKTTRVSDYSKMIGVSTKTLNSICKNTIHKSAKEFIDEIATKQIKRLLINTSLSIKEIAYQSGFEETTNFFKYFKRQTGQTPEQFRTNH